MGYPDGPMINWYIFRPGISYTGTDLHAQTVYPVDVRTTRVTTRLILLFDSEMPGLLAVISSLGLQYGF